MPATQPAFDSAAVWRSAPSERSAAFTEAFGAVARGLQQSLRQQIPSRFFLRPDSHLDRRLALARLVFQCSRPTPPRRGREFTYDIVDTSMMAGFYWGVRQVLPAELSWLQVRMLTAGRFDLARSYAPRHSAAIVAEVRARPQLLGRLLSAEGSLLRDLLQFSAAFRLQDSPSRAARLQDNLMRSWMRTLSRVYPGLDASDLAANLFEAATGVMAGFDERTFASAA